jgi:hypothetical protein
MVVHLYIQSWSLSRCLSVIFRGQYLLALNIREKEGRSLFLDNFVFLPYIYDRLSSAMFVWNSGIHSCPMTRLLYNGRGHHPSIHLSIYFFSLSLFLFCFISNDHIEHKHKKERWMRQMDIQKWTMMVYLLFSYQFILRLIVSCRIYFVCYISWSYSFN